MTAEHNHRGKHIDALKLKIARGRSNLGRCKNQRATWKKLREVLSQPAIGNETMAEYLRMPKAQQDGMKNVSGWFIGGHCDGGHRKASNIAERTLVTFDIDEGTPELLDELEMGFAPICNYEFFVYSTRKHTPEQPRLRIVIPLAQPCEAEQYHALARILASKVCSDMSAAMDAVDDVSFRLAQMMYMPSRCKDGEFLTIYNEAALANPDEILAEFGDWQDATKLPYSEKQGQKRVVDPNAKAENPREKRGIIGAFCRTYDVERAIAEFLPDVYELGDDKATKPRYSYIGGSTTNGAIVEDDGLFLYSHHSTDPCGERLVNAWDLVRIHRFGHEDQNHNEEQSKPQQMPSYKAMAKFAQQLDPVRKAMAKDNYDLTAMFEDLPTEADSLGDDLDDLIGSPVEPSGKHTVTPPDWFNDLEMDDNGLLKSTEANLAQIVLYDDRFSGCIAFNEFMNSRVLRKKLNTRLPFVPVYDVPDFENGERWKDSYSNAVHMVLTSARGDGKAGYGLNPPDKSVTKAIKNAADMHKFHPIKEFLEGIEWDGEHRLDDLFIRYLGIEDNPYNREVSWLTFVAAVARLYEPGHKYDYMLIIDGGQGISKTTFYETLAMYRWYGGYSSDLDNHQKVVEGTAGKLIIEMPELSKFRSSEVEDLKDFVTRRCETARLAYGTDSNDFWRQFILVGTTNSTRYLKDETGNRRFLPVHVPVHSIDIESLKEEVPQVWAEALVRYRQMRKDNPHSKWLRLVLSEDARAIAEAEQGERMVVTAETELAAQIADWLNEPVNNAVDAFEGDDFVPVYRDMATAKEIWTEALHFNWENFNKQAWTFGKSMDMVEGWSRVRKRVNGGNPRVVYVRDGSKEDASISTMQHNAGLTDVEDLI